MADTCSTCKKQLTGINDTHRFVYQGGIYCIKCSEGIKVKAEDELQEKIKTIIVTTTNNFEGYRIKKYIDIESAEVVMGTGIFSEISGGLADFVGQRSTGFESKMQKAKKAAFDQLKILAIQKGGNAVVGVDIDYSEFAGNRTAVIANGTIVEIEPLIKS